MINNRHAKHLGRKLVWENLLYWQDAEVTSNVEGSVLELIAGQQGRVPIDQFNGERQGSEKYLRSVNFQSIRPHLLLFTELLGSESIDSSGPIIGALPQYPLRLRYNCS